VGSEKNSSDCNPSLEAKTEVSTGLRGDIPTQQRISITYLCWPSMRPILVGATLIPKKQWATPKSRSLNSKLNEVMRR
jgi:hypothetical protein